MKFNPPLVFCDICQRLALAVGFALLAPLSGMAQSADPYTAKLHAGDSKTASGDHAGAAADYEGALADAQTPTQRALALGKKSVVLAHKQDYAGAREAVDAALAEGASLEPVAEVTVLQALAKCQLFEKNYAGALESMTRAAGLPGVEWARQDVTMIRGDAERGCGMFDAALASYRSILDMPEVSNEYKGVAWFNIGLTEQYSLVNGANAKEAYLKAGELNPGLKASAEKHLAKIQ